MGTLQLNSYGLASFQVPYNFNTQNSLKVSRHLSFPRGKIRAVGTIPESESEAKESEEPPSVNFAFVHSVLLPDGTPDVHFRIACGGQKLRNIMLDSNIELYGPYERPLLNCAGGGTCATCMVESRANLESNFKCDYRENKKGFELMMARYLQITTMTLVIEGRELLSPRTEKEKEKLKRKPKNWRLACQTTVGTPESRGLVVIQQLPEWKAHEWTYEKIPPSEMLS